MGGRRLRAIRRAVIYVTTRHHEDPAVVDARTGKIIEMEQGANPARHIKSDDVPGDE